MKALLLLDYDGVIVDSAQPVLDQTAVFCSENDLPFDLTHADFDRINPATFTMLAKICGIPQDDHRRYGKFLFDKLQSGAARIPIFDGIPQMLRDLSQRLHICVVTANHSNVVRTRLAHDGLDQCIHGYFGSDRPGNKADHIREALADYGVANRAAWMVGDSVSDIDAAKVSGVNSIAAGWGWQSVHLLRSTAPDQLFHSPAELHAFFTTAEDAPLVQND